MLMIPLFINLNQLNLELGEDILGMELNYMEGMFNALKWFRPTIVSLVHGVIP